MITLIDWLDLIKKNLKRELRQVRRLDLLMGFIKPLKVLNIDFNARAVAINYKLLFNGQTIYLEHYLNNTYDNFERRIWIQNTGNTNAVTIYGKAEGQPDLFVYGVAETAAPIIYLYGKTEPLTMTHFIVWVPTVITYTEVVMRAQIDQYRIMGKNYLIQTFVA